MTDSPPPSAPSGWYADPQGHSTWRYWDGARWTDHVSGGAHHNTSDSGPDRTANNVGPLGGEGWYPDPYGEAPWRYWDGEKWLPHTSTRHNMPVLRPASEWKRVGPHRMSMYRVLWTTTAVLLGVGGLIIVFILAVSFATMPSYP